VTDAEDAVENDRSQDTDVLTMIGRIRRSRRTTDGSPVANVLDHSNASAVYVNDWVPWNTIHSSGKILRSPVSGGESNPSAGTRDGPISGCAQFDREWFDQQCRV
jgi:hypothetical protein